MVFWLTFEVTPADQIPHPTISEAAICCLPLSGQVGKNFVMLHNKLPRGSFHKELDVYQVGNHQVLGQLLMSATTQWEARL